MNTDSASAQDAGETVAITPELVREVTEKVYVLLLQDLKLARERMGHAAVGLRDNGGRWC
ncbi:MAG: hypothetical protein R2867_15915 [Caldilineaceae bacterium]